MAIPKVFGTEIEYGITAAGAPDFNPVLSLLAADLDVRGIAAAASAGTTSRSPRCATRAGSSRCRRTPDPTRTSARNKILPNGARYYVDHAHPEYSTPGVPHAARAGGPRQGGRADPRALAARGRARDARAPAPCRSTRTTATARATRTARTRTTWWTARTPFTRHRRDLTPFFVTRQVFTGAGKVGAEARDERGPREYQLTQRADFFETEVGLDTMVKRPIINTRDEPHADREKYRRLHVIVGDANMCEVAIYLKIGTTAIVLKMIEDALPARPHRSQNPGRGDQGGLARPRPARATIALADGRRLTAVQLQWEYLEHAQQVRRARGRHARAAEVLERWEARARGPRERSDRARTRARLGDQERADRGLPGARRPRLGRSRKLQRDRPAVPRRPPRPGPVLPARGLGQGASGSRPTRRSTRRSSEPPEDTRAYFRGRCISRYPDAIAASTGTR